MSVSTHDELVRTQWRLVEVLEGMSPEEARVLGEADHDAQYAQAAADLPRLRLWPSLPERKYRVYTNPHNQARMHRVCQFLDSTDRVLDVGTNYGYFSGLVGKLVRPAAYTGIDLGERYLDGVRQMAEANELDIAPWSLEVKDLYELRPEWVAKHDPTIVLLLEVLEHLPDPQGALKIFAEVLPDEAQLLFSVPMLGRLEACWGHVSLFDAERVRQLCSDCGLHIHWVEPLVNTWKLVLASRSSSPPDRLMRVIATPPAVRATEAAGDPRFHAIRMDPAALGASLKTTGRVTASVSADATRGVRLDAHGVRRRTQRPNTLAREARLVLPVEGLRAFRVEVEALDRSGIAELAIEGVDAAGNVTCRWQFVATAKRQVPKKPTTYVLRPGRTTAGFVPSGEHSEVARTRTLQVVIKLAPRGSASMAFRRAAYVR